MMMRRRSAPPAQEADPTRDWPPYLQVVVMNKLCPFASKAVIGLSMASKNYAEVCQNGYNDVLEVFDALADW